jgi:arsenate reductase (thioredoxin)
VKSKILYLCTGNSCRSQMAEGWTRALKGDLLEAFSAGIQPKGMDARAVRAMAEAGIDISKQKSKDIDSLGNLEFEYVVTLCDNARESCPFFPAKTKRIHQRFDDPPVLADGVETDEEAMVPYRRVRDEIKAFVQTLPESLRSEHHG